MHWYRQSSEHVHCTDQDYDDLTSVSKTYNVGECLATITMEYAAHEEKTCSISLQAIMIWHSQR